MTAPLPPPWLHSLSPGPPHLFRGRRVLIWSVGMVGLFAVIVTLAILSAPSTITVRGQVDGRSSPDPAEAARSGFAATGADGACTGHGEFGDIRQGTAVAVYHGDGSPAGTGQLQAGTGTDGHCTFAFEIPDVPVDRRFQVEVAAHGRFYYSDDDVDEGIRMNLGS